MREADHFLGLGMQEPSDPKLGKLANSVLATTSGCCTGVLCRPRVAAGYLAQLQMLSNDNMLVTTSDATDPAAHLLFVVVPLLQQKVCCCWWNCQRYCLLLPVIAVAQGLYEAYGASQHCSTLAVTLSQSD